ncbi:LysR family transcriptional regulator [Streptomyces sp. NPDC053741]|uniref:Transcriptional regulator, LysR family n=1 Tax=Streptomyces pratensis (strain ATCC 33331 / IAF-45CD) TaxID=591167 RepID=A0A8D3WF90_STRFA|nr:MULTISPECIES: LysR family transcriptional regulator [Streptomyces]MDF9868142.1 DNA-binding transcriptional LysR family regulator [Streptomyces pratensis]TPN00048.1 LysR family transcriptional regulator [Mesorhizobium sp. B2-3-3]MCY1655362.1 LysR family transcriptional regulator [Streptomyces sp. SL203]MCY1677291.1 LysR family transcriptional regulator [Streptomyces sp. SL294]MDF6066586.1 LysR family transcriptional regulator [Streptomyces sp. JH010]
MFDLRRSDVVLLQAVVDHGSLHAVERDGWMTQSSASRRLVKLERRLRTALVSRGATGTEPTEAGHALLHVGRRLLASIDFAIATTHHGAGAASRLPVVEFAVGSEWAYGLDGHLAGRFPDVVFDIVPDDSHRIWQRFERYAADAALGWETARRPMARRGDVLIRTIAEEPQQIALPSGHPLAEQGILDLRGLTGADWVAVVGGDSGDDQGWALSRLTPVPSVSFTVRSQGAALDLVRRGYGIALVSPSSLGGSPARGVVLRPLRQKFVRRLRLAVDPLAIPEPLAEDLCASLRRRYVLRTTAHGSVPAVTQQDPDRGTPADPADAGCAVPPPVLLSELHWSSPGRCGGFEPEHLHLLRVIGRTGSLNQAASALLVTQPALTRRIRRLEASCGLPLVHSTARGTSLSATARRLLACTGPAEHRLDALANHLRQSGPAAGMPPAEGAAGPVPSPVRPRKAPR